MTLRVFVRIAFVAAAALLAAVMFAPAGEAHKAITSKFTYNADVYTVFLNRCSHCHVAGGVGPMSLVTFEDASPWGESLRTELLDAPYGGPDDYIKAAHRDLSARELDTVIDWAVGGNPEGEKDKVPPAYTLKNDWAGAKPDLILQPDAPFMVPDDTMDVTHEFVLPTHLSAARQIRAVDLLPGAPAVVRDATILVRTGNAEPTPIGRWIPRQVPEAVTLKPGISIPAGADVLVRLHYKKTWKYEGKAMPDKSSIGLYFGDK